MTDAAVLHEPPEGTPPAPAGAPCELRVLAGRSAGASVPIARKRWIEVGHAFSNDVVLRDPGARGVRLRLRAGDDSAELDLIEGSVELLGHSMTGPASAILPPYVPLMLGESAIAFGDPDGRRWSDADRLLRAARPDAANDTEAEDTTSDTGVLPPWRVISPAASALPKLAPLVPIFGGAVASVAVLVIGWAAVTHWLSATPSPAKAQAALAAAGFKGVEVGSDANGLVIKGVLAHGADLTRLQADVQARGWPATYTVKTNDALVQNVGDVLRTNGFEADVKAIGVGVLAASVKGGDPARLELLRRRTLKDVPGLRQLVVNGGGDGADLLAGDPNKQVTAVVGGDDGYVKTADGSRYFVGAMLPSGHTIVSIDGQTVRAEKDGRTTDLKF